MSRIDRARYGPSWTEVILGAVLSLVLGVVLGAVLLVLRPVTIVRDLPKEPDPKAVYYIEGARDASKAQVLAKRQAFLSGQSISLTESDLNVAVGSTPMSSALTAAAPQKKDSAPDETIQVGAPNFRIREGTFTMGVPVAFNVLGATPRVVFQTKGSFVKAGESFAYEPAEIYLGSCPLQRLPFVAGYIREKFLSLQALPEDIRASWTRLANVAIEGNTLKLTMP